MHQTAQAIPDAPLVMRAVAQHRRLAVTLALSLFTASTASAAAGQSFRGVCTGTSAPRLQVSGTRFTIDGEPRFPVLVSYFDAMRATPAALESDFAFLKSKGVNGIRIFPLWIRDAGMPGAQTAAATLLDSDGRIRSQERWDHFVAVLSRAAACGFIVDVTFNRESLHAVAPFTVAEYHGDPKQTTCGGGTGARGRGLAEIVCRLKTPAFTHVFIDMQNERNVGNPGMALTMGEVRAIRHAIKSVDANRLVAVSHGGGDIANALAAAKEAPLDVIAFHEEQQSGSAKSTAAHVAALEPAGRPVYIQEGPRATLAGERFRGASCTRATPEENPFLVAVAEAKRAGAAAWTFHTDAGFRLDTQSFQQELNACQREVDFLNQFRKIVD